MKDCIGREVEPGDIIGVVMPSGGMYGSIKSATLVSLDPFKVKWSSGKISNVMKHKESRIVLLVPKEFVDDARGLYRQS